MKDLSIIIINFNTFDLTSKCINSIYKFSKKIDFEIIVVDNASTECRPDKFKELFPEVVLVKSNKNIGFAKGNNLGIKYSTGKLLLLLNSDTYFVDGSLNYAKEILDLCSDVDVLTGKLTYPNGEIQPQCGKFPSIKLQIFELLRMQKFLSSEQRGRLFLGTFFDHQSTAFPETIWGTFFLFRREVLEVFKEKKLPDKYFMYMEDLDWCYKIRKAGLKIMYEPRVHIVHYFSGSKGEAKKELLRNNFSDLIKSNKGILYYILFRLVLNINQCVERIKIKLQ